MSETEHGESPAGRDALRGLAGEVDPPAGSEDAVVASLRRQGLVGTGFGGRPRRWVVRLAAAAAIGAAFLGGLALGRGGEPAGRAAESPRFVLLLEETAATAAIDPDELPRVVAEYAAWAERARAGGRALQGEKLAPAGRRLVAREGTVGVEPAPAAGVDRGLGGYFVLEAPDWDSALAVARTCPHLRYGGAIEVRRIDEV